jgi:putative exosortase-associated protein (TIGR04073 family)
MKKWTVLATVLILCWVTWSAAAQAPAPEPAAPVKPEAAPAKPEAKEPAKPAPEAKAEPKPEAKAEEEEEEEPPDIDEVLAEYTKKATHKFFRGGVNLAFGLVEIPVQTYREPSFRGFGRGCRDAVYRMGTGALDLVTFLLPWPRRDYRPMIMPEFPAGRKKERR